MATISINTLNSDGSRCGQDVGHGVAADAFEESHSSRSRVSRSPSSHSQRGRTAPPGQHSEGHEFTLVISTPFSKFFLIFSFFFLLNEPVCVFIINTQLLMPCIYEHLLGKQDSFESETVKYYKVFFFFVALDKGL